MYHYLVWRDRDGDVRELRRYRKLGAATEVRDRYLELHGPHTGQPGTTIDLRIYSAESFDIILANHADFDVWSGGTAMLESRP